MSTKDAVERFSQKAFSSDTRVSRKNNKPEKTVERDCMAWFDSFGFSMHVVESKSVWSVSANRYLRGQAIAGFPDSCGCTPVGLGAFVEFKARGRRHTLRPVQKDFLRIKILKGCFACVVDSSKFLEEIYHSWVQLAHFGQDKQIAYLLNQLPRKKKRSANNTDSF